MRSTLHPPEWLKLKRLTTLNVGKHVEQLEPSYIVGGNVKQSNHFRGKVCQFLLKEKIAPNNVLLSIFYSDIETQISKKRFVQNIHSSFIHNSQKLETHQMSINKWINRLVHSYNRLLLINKKEKKNYWYMQKHRWISKTCWVKEILSKKSTCDNEFPYMKF